MLHDCRGCLAPRRRKISIHYHDWTDVGACAVVVQPLVLPHLRHATTDKPTMKSHDSHHYTACERFEGSSPHLLWIRGFEGQAREWRV